MTKIINLFGAPGAGKSTSATGAFSLLKIHGINCEYVSEFAKDLTWENRHETIKCQPYIAGKQLRNVERLIGKVDVVITDSPILLSRFYAQKYTNYPASFSDFILDQFNGMNNYNFFLQRMKAYNPIGRNQSEEESDDFGIDMEQMLINLGISYEGIQGDARAPSVIANRVLELLSR